MTDKTSTEKPAIIRLPPTTGDRKKAWTRAAQAEGMKLTDWIWKVGDEAAALTRGTKMSAEARAAANHLTREEREKLVAEGMDLITKNLNRSHHNPPDV